MVHSEYHLAGKTFIKVFKGTNREVEQALVDEGYDLNKLQKLTSYYDDKFYTFVIDEDENKHKALI